MFNLRVVDLTHNNTCDGSFKLKLQLQQLVAKSQNKLHLKPTKIPYKIQI